MITSASTRRMALTAGFAFIFLFIGSLSFPLYLLAQGSREEEVLIQMLTDMFREAKLELALNKNSLDELEKYKESQTAELSGIKDSLLDIGESIKSSRQSLAKIEQRKSILEIQEEKVYAKLKELDNRMAALEKQSALLNDCFKTTAKALFKLGRDPKLLTKELSGIGKKSDDLDKQYQALKTDYDKYYAQLNDSRLKSSSLAKEKEELASTVNEKQRRLDQIQQKLDMISRERASAAIKGAGTETETPPLSPFFSDYQRSIDEFMSHNRGKIALLEQENSRKDEELGRLKNQIAQVSSQKENESAKLVQLKNQKEEESAKLRGDILAAQIQKEEEIKKLNAQVKNRRDEELNKLKEQIARLNAEKEKQLAWEAEEKNRKAQELAKMETRLKEIKGQMQEMENKFNTQTGQQVRLKEQLDQSNRQRENEIKDLKAQKDKEAAELKTQAAVETAKLNAQIALGTQLAQDKLQKEKELSVLNEQFVSQKNVIAQRDAEALKLNRTISRLQEDLEAEQDAKRQLSEERDIFKAQQNQFLARIRELEGQAEILKKEISKTNQVNSLLKDEYVSAAQELYGLKKQNQQVKAVRQPKTEAKERVSSPEKILPEIVTPPDDARNCNELERRYKEVVRQNKDMINKYGNLPKDAARAHYNLGVLYTQSRDYDKAVSEFNKVLEYDPDDSETHYNLGVIYSEYLDKREKALGHFKKYLSLSPKDIDAEQVRKYIVTLETLEQK